MVSADLTDKLSGVGKIVKRSGEPRGGVRVIL